VQKSLKTERLRPNINIQIEQVGKGGLRPLVWPDLVRQCLQLGKAGGGKPPFPTCSIQLIL